MTTPDPGGSPKLARVAARVRKLLEQAARVRSRAQISGFERPILGVAFIIFLVATVAAARNLPDIESGIRWSFVPFVVLLIPAGVTFNAAEYLVSGLIAGHRVGMFAAARVAVMASAANQLPLPGSVLVRTQSLKEAGAGYGRALGSTGITGLAYMGAALLLAGAVLLPGQRTTMAAGLCGIGLTFVLLTYVGIRAYVPQRALHRATTLLIVEVGSTLAKAAAFYVIARGLHFDLSFAQAVVITLSVVITSSVGFFPGGLGLRELLAGAISPLVDVPATIGVVVMAASRVVGLVVLGALALLLAFIGRLRRSDSVGEIERGVECGDSALPVTPSANRSAN